MEIYIPCGKKMLFAWRMKSRSTESRINYSFLKYSIGAADILHRLLYKNIKMHAAYTIVSWFYKRIKWHTTYTIVSWPYEIYIYINICSLSCHIKPVMSCFIYNNSEMYTKLWEKSWDKIKMWAFFLTCIKENHRSWSQIRYHFV